MIIELKKFGTTLTSRQSGKEALLAFRPILNLVPANEKIEIDFSGVNTFTPSWGDEFLTSLQNEYRERFFLKESFNLSVKATIEILEETNEIKFQIKK
ncbi:MAG: hypothetical protein US30_C0012G0053 [Candidatus Moranbacteria bacterium GW2011_GWF2_36_839]|nr:MAG: hypothetical protein US27_C0012G0027 [Candidatus Moranbacteria bacterium GW2011_GWF1_36_78]KKQ16743.1 MAG: hypothetical protein US30_C0012G0053 [Candidatus Moranbacteria bacterium GW2011_GWF2_36_839]HAT74256.1 hypothetical protein [Candidatus Moranbacteria bacterium]HBY11376.1 hypothetical protein [Candidatus Moranbacteria bacterium]